MDMELAWGLWIGQISGTNEGTIMLSIDADRLNTAFVCLHDNDPAVPSVRAIFDLKREGKSIVGTSSLVLPFLDPDYPTNPNAVAPQKINFEGEFNDDWEISGNWQTDIDTNGQLKLYDNIQVESSPPDHELSWTDFKSFIHEKAKSNPDAIFRGQSDSSWPLVTSFHRTNRRNLFRYQEEDLNDLNKYVAAQLGRKFFLQDGGDLSELVLLGQHHGYPTPFLDWTRSPYVAAFFGFNSLDKYEDHDGKVRIFIFYGQRWRNSGLSGGTALIDPRPSFNLLDIVSSSNTRVLPQQGLVTFTNLMSIEHYLKYIEKQTGEKYLEIVDIEAKQRNDVIADLSLMGINAASLFPGLDATCQTLKERAF